MQPQGLDSDQKVKCMFWAQTLCLQVTGFSQLEFEGMQHFSASKQSSVSSHAFPLFPLVFLAN